MMMETESMERPQTYMRPRMSMSTRTTQSITRMAHWTLAMTKRQMMKTAMRAEVRTVHAEMLRQFHEAREEQLDAFEELKASNAKLASEVAALRKAQSEYVRR